MIEIEQVALWHHLSQIAAMALFVPFFRRIRSLSGCSGLFGNRRQNNGKMNGKEVIVGNIQIKYFH